MSFGMVTAAVSVGGMLLGASEGRKAQSQAADANAAALAAQEEATNKRLAFDEKVYADGEADRKFASDQARLMAGWQTEDRTKYNALQDEQIARGRIFQTAEDGILGDAQTYDTEARRDSAGARAMAGVQGQFDAVNEQTQRQLARKGVAPGSAKSLIAMQGIGTQQASAIANADTQARDKVELQGYARKMDAVGLGRGIIGNQATQAGLQLNAGNSSVGNAQIPLGVSAAANGAMSAGYGNAAQGYSNLGTNQARSFYSAADYGAGVAQNVGNFIGGLGRNLMSSSMGGIFQPSGVASYGTANDARWAGNGGTGD